jgi:hypothetical protein
MVKRGGGRTTAAGTLDAAGRYHYGTGEEVAGRLEDGYPATESHFSQIPPRGSLSPKGRSFDEHGTKGQKQQAGAPVEYNGDFGAGIDKRGNP